MIINMDCNAPPEDVLRIVNLLRDERVGSQVVRLGDRIVVVAETWIDDIHQHRSITQLASVLGVVAVDVPFKLASRECHPPSSLVTVGGVTFGDGRTVVIAGPCAVESRGQILLSARAAAHAGAVMLRGGAFKPRTSPYDFQGLGVEGLKFLREAGNETGLPVVTEVISPEHIDDVAEYTDMLQVGARNMQNFELLKRLATIGKPVLLKRGLAATVTEWLLSAEYLLLGGNTNIVLCERGVRGFGNETRNMLDVSAISLAKQLSHLPVIADPSHATGRTDLVLAVSRAALAAGADGLIVEIHPDPERALSDGTQSLDLHEFAEFMRDLRKPLRFKMAPPSSIGGELATAIPHSSGIEPEFE